MFDKLKLFAKDKQKALRYRMISEQRYYSGYDDEYGFTYFYANTVCGIVYMCYREHTYYAFNIETGNWDNVMLADYYNSYSTYIDTNPSDTSNSFSNNMGILGLYARELVRYYNHEDDIDIPEPEKINPEANTDSRLNTLYFMIMSFLESSMRTKELAKFISNILDVDTEVRDHLNSKYSDFVNMMKDFKNTLGYTLNKMCDYCDYMQEDSYANGYCSDEDEDLNFHAFTRFKNGPDREAVI